MTRYLRILRTSQPGVRWHLAGTAAYCIYEGSLRVILNLYVLARGLDERDVAGLIAVMAITGALVAVPTGLLADRIPRARVMLAGGVLSLLGLSMMLAAPDRTWLFIGQAVSATGLPAFWALSPAYLADGVPKEDRAYVFGLHFALLPLFAGFGQVMSGYVPGWFGGGPGGYRAGLMVGWLALLAYLLTRLPMVAADGGVPGRGVNGRRQGQGRGQRQGQSLRQTPGQAPLQAGTGTAAQLPGSPPAEPALAIGPSRPAPTRDEGARAGGQRAHSRPANVLGRFMDHPRQVFWFALHMLVMTTAFFLFDPFLNVILQGRYGLGDAAIGWILTAQSLVLVAAGLLGPVLSEGRGLLQVATVLQVLALPPLMAMGWAGAAGAFAGLLVLRTVLWEMTAPILDTYRNETYSRRERGTAHALLEVGWQVGAVLGALLAGPLLQAGRFETLFTLAALISGAATALLYGVFRSTALKAISEACRSEKSSSS